MLAVIDLATVDFARHPVPRHRIAIVPGCLPSPALSRLGTVRARLERSHLVPAGRIVLTGLNAERHAIGDLLAQPMVADRVTIPGTTRSGACTPVTIRRPGRHPGGGDRAPA